jgi:hypothetical protein
MTRASGLIHGHTRTDGLCKKPLDKSVKVWYTMGMKQNIVDIVGRDPGCGRVAFRTGVVLSRKNKINKRGSKHARREHERAIRGE